MVSDEDPKEVRSGVDDYTELLHEGLAVQEVVGGDEEVPGGGGHYVGEVTAHHDRDRNQGRLSIL